MKEIEGLTREEERAAAVFRAMGNPARVRIVRELSLRRACATSDFVALLPLAQSTVSQHLKVLKDAGIIQGVIEGGDQCYCLEPETVRWLSLFTHGICCPDETDCGPDTCSGPEC
ncbi:MAG: helix-turn-helix transcriptional regulator [Dehalococcoidia bacterium]|nr:helix-turn-helix transcriptional regulator [Dehalococcoidia bacterium]